MTNSAAAYRSIAGSVRMQLLDTRLGNGLPTRPLDDYAKRRLGTIKNLLQVGNRFSGKPHGSLDMRSATPEKMSLALDIEELVPWKLPDYEQEKDMQGWTQRAVGIIDAMAAADQSKFKADMDFVELELEGFLEAILRLPPERPQRRRSAGRLR